MADNKALIGFIGVALTIMAGMLGYFLIDLNKRVEDQSKEISKLEKNLAIIVTVLNPLVPKANLTVLVAYMEEKSVPLDKVSTVMFLLNNNPGQAKTYLQQQLNFTPAETNFALSPGSIGNIKAGSEGGYMNGKVQN